MNDMKNDSKELDKKMDAVLYGGKDSAKRVYAVDETLYGQSDGLKLKKQPFRDWKRLGTYRKRDCVQHGLGNTQKVSRRRDRVGQKRR